MRVNPSQKKIFEFFEAVSPEKSGKCIDCGKKLGFFSRNFLGKSYFCAPCYEKRTDQVNQALSRYSEKLVKALQDGQITEQEKAELDKLKADFGLSDYAIKHASTGAYQRLYQEITSDRLVTEDELQQVNELLAKYEIHVDEIKPTLNELGKLRFMTMLEDGVLPEVESSIFLRKNETAHFQTQCELHEERTKKEYVGGYSGFSFRVAKGVSWRVGGFKGRPVEKQVLTRIDSGVLVVTNKRLVFSGDRKSFSVPYRKLIDLEVFKDAIKLNREGKSRREYFMMDEPAITAKVINLVVNQED